MQLDSLPYSKTGAPVLDPTRIPQEKLNDSYISRILRLTLLAPDIVEAILDGRQPADLTLADLMEPFPMVWSEQREKWGFPELPI